MDYTPLLHDAIYNSQFADPQIDRSNLLLGLEQALAKLHSHYQFVTVPKLLQTGRAIKVLWEMSNKAS